jgi:aminopeptidase N
LAAQRARVISDVRYELRFTIPDSLSQRVVGREIVRFNLSEAGRPLVFDFEESRESLLGVLISGQDAAAEFVNGHIVIPANALGPGENAVEIEFLAGDNSLNRNREFLYTLFVPDRARFAFPCFDQPNLKARYSLTLDVPAAWEAVANGASLSREVGGDRAVIQFAETNPISTYLFSFAAGVFQVEETERGGRAMRMYHRETDADKVTRNLDAVFDLHQVALDWLEEYTGIEYPFEKFAFVLIPAFQYSGMEHPGAILYRSSRLLLDESATQNEKLSRASLIAHETAHMWFGDLVTMDWFNDVWMKEVFANFMAAKIVHPSFPDIDHELRFLLAHYPTAYGVDRTPGANPIRQQLDNLKEAGTLYGAIIYQKAPIVMKQLEGLVGETNLRDGLREYLQAYQFANATWPDLIAILDQRSPEDLAAWSHAWVEEARRPTIAAEMSIDQDGSIGALSVKQMDPEGRGRIWNQSLGLTLGYAHTERAFPVQLASTSATIDSAEGLPAPEYILVNGRGVGYGLFGLDSASLEYLLEETPSLPKALTRGIAWLTLWDAMLEGQVPPQRIADLAVRSLNVETDELLVQRTLAYLQTVYWRYLSPEDRLSRAPELESLLWDLLEGAPAPSLKATYFNALRSIALSESTLRRLAGVWSQAEQIDGLPLSERDYIALSRALAVREIDGWEAILDAQVERIENPDRREQFLFVLPSLSADQRVRDDFFASLTNPKNREHEPWVLEALRYLHHPLRAGDSEKYILASLELLEEIQATGDIFFPKGWLDGTLGGHNSSSAAEIVQNFLAANPDYPVKLNGKILQSADGLYRAAEITEFNR